MWCRQYKQGKICVYNSSHYRFLHGKKGQYTLRWIEDGIVLGGGTSYTQRENRYSMNTALSLACVYFLS